MNWVLIMNSVIDEKIEDNGYDSWTICLCAKPTPKGLLICHMGYEVIGELEDYVDVNEDGSYSIMTK